MVEYYFNPNQRSSTFAIPASQPCKQKLQKSLPCQPEERKTTKRQQIRLKRSRQT